MKAYLYNLAPSWDAIRTLGENKLLQSSYFWFIFIAIIAKSLLPIMVDKFDIRLFDQIFSINLSLPFSWVVLFYTAVVFGFANLIYMYFVPDFVKDQKNYADFKRQGKNGFDITCELSRLSNEGIPLDGFSNLDEYCNQFHTSYCEDIHGYDFKDMPNKDKLKHETIKEEFENVAFWKVYDYSNISRPGYRLLSSFFYLTGFILLGMLFVQNIYSVTLLVIG